MTRDVHMGRADLVPRRQIGQCQRYARVARHEVEHALIKAPHGVSEPSTQMGLPPPVIVYFQSFKRCVGGKFHGFK
jgi:hypothetical protein